MKTKSGKIFIFSLIFIFLGALIFSISAISNNFFNQVALCIFIMVVGIVALVILFFITIYYNKMIRYRNKVDESLALIDIQLKLRFDLIPNLVNTVKGYMEHEKGILTEVTKLRNLAVGATDEKEKIEMANKLLPKVNQIIAIAEKYPDLKSDALFKSLMEELVLIEDKLVAARRFYDSNVNEFNTLIAVWPANIVAKIFNFTKKELFKIDAAERISVKVEV